MDKERNSNCWYKDVCTLESCTNCIRYLEMKYLLDNSGIPKSRQLPMILDAGVDYDAFCKLADLKDDIVNFVNRGANLYICSRVTGNGKTSWAIKLMLKYFDNVWAGNGFRVRGMFVHVPTLINQLKNFESPLSQEYKDNLINADLVIWDDIASTKLSEYDHSQLLSYIDQREFKDLSNIFTGNIIGIAALENSVGIRLASRLWNNSTVIEFNGKDRRK